MSNNKPQIEIESCPQDCRNDTRANYFGIFNPPESEPETPAAETTPYDAHIRAREAFEIDLDAAMDAINHTRANMFEWRMPGISHAPDISNQKTETDAGDNPDAVGLSKAA